MGMKQLRPVPLPQEYLDMTNKFGPVKPIENRSVDPNTRAISFVAGWAAMHLIPLGEDGHKFIAIDGGVETAIDDVVQLLAELGRSTIDIEAMYLTHYHMDHTGLGTTLNSHGYGVYAGSEEISDLWNFSGIVASPITPDEIRRYGEVEVRAIATPGHSPGSISYLVTTTFGKTLFTGDSLDTGPDGTVQLPPSSLPFEQDYDAIRRSVQGLTDTVVSNPGVIIRPSHSAALSDEAFLATVSNLQ